MDIFESIKRAMRSKGNDRLALIPIAVAVIVFGLVVFFWIWADVVPGNLGWDFLSFVIVMTVVVSLTRRIWNRHSLTYRSNAAILDTSTLGDHPHSPVQEVPVLVESPESSGPETMIIERYDPEEAHVAEVEREMTKREKLTAKLVPVRASSREKIRAAEHKRGVYVPKSLKLYDDEIIEHVQRLYWMKMLPPAIIFVVAAILYFYSQNTLADQVALQILLLAAIGGIVLYQYYRIVTGFISSITPKQFWLAFAVIVIAGVVLRDYLPDWLMWALEKVSDMLEWIGWDIGNMMIILIVLSGLLCIAEVVAWLINPAIITNQRLIIVQGFIYFKFKSVKLKSITDQDLRTVSFFPFGTLIVETAGQEQSVSRVKFFPHTLFEKLRTGVDTGAGSNDD